MHWFRSKGVATLSLRCKIRVSHLIKYAGLVEDWWTLFSPSTTQD